MNQKTRDQVKTNNFLNRELSLLQVIGESIGLALCALPWIAIAFI